MSLQTDLPTCVLLALLSVCPRLSRMQPSLTQVFVSSPVGSPGGSSEGLGS